jgi:glutamyl-tRNA synthetase
VPVAEKVGHVLPYLQRAGLMGAEPSTEELHRIERIVAAAGDRIKVFGDILDYRDFFTPDDQLQYDERDFEKRIRKPSEAAGLLAAIKGDLALVEPFDASHIEQFLGEFVERQGIKIGQVIHPLRVAVTGKSVGFGLFDTLEILGKQRVVNRIQRAIEIC